MFISLYLSSNVANHFVSASSCLKTTSFLRPHPSHIRQRGLPLVSTRTRRRENEMIELVDTYFDHIYRIVEMYDRLQCCRVVVWRLLITWLSGLLFIKVVSDHPFVYELVSMSQAVSLEADVLGAVFRFADLLTRFLVNFR